MTDKEKLREMIFEVTKIKYELSSKARIVEKIQALQNMILTKIDVISSESCVKELEEIFELLHDFSKRQVGIKELMRNE